MELGKKKEEPNSLQLALPLLQMEDGGKGENELNRRENGEEKKKKERFTISQQRWWLKFTIEVKKTKK